MKKKLVYLLAGIAVVFLLVGGRKYAISDKKTDRKLGKEIVYIENEDSGAPATDEIVVVSEEPESTQTENTASENQGNESVQENTAAQNPSSQGAGTDTSAYPKITSDKKVQLYDTGTAVIGDTGYEQYSYVESAAKKYATVSDKISKSLGKNVNLYSCIVPTSAGITVPDNKKDKIGSSNQQESILKIEKKFKGDEKIVSLYDTLMHHRNEYIYFRTDHHWTPLGAYYAYAAFCEAKGIAANDLSTYKKKNYKGFVGTFYQDSHNNKNLKKDILKAIYPLGKKISMYYRNTAGQKIHAPVIDNASRYGASLKYCAYIAGDNPMTVIKNKEIKDGSSCVVIKESFGNVFVPYLADHYQNVYVIDYRYWDGNLSKFVKQRKVSDVILMNNISMTRNVYLIGKLENILS